MLGKAVCHQPTGVEMSKGMPSRQFGAWEGCSWTFILQVGDLQPSQAPNCVAWVNQ